MEKIDKNIILSLEERLGALKAEIDRISEEIKALKAVPEELPVPAPAPAPEDIPEDDGVDFTGIELGLDDIELEPVPTGAEAEPIPEPLPEPIPEPVPEAEEEEEFPEGPDISATAHLPWRTDRVGIRVKNLRSAISLYDRALFIGTLFKEDYSLYDSTISALNNLETLDEAVEYIVVHFPEWNLRSDVVYNFMMAVRKKLG